MFYMPVHVYMSMMGGREGGTKGWYTGINDQEREKECDFFFLTLGSLGSGKFVNCGRIKWSGFDSLAELPLNYLLNPRHMSVLYFLVFLS